NANHIFNAIHSSMRQWGSSLNHNGMSFFLATVPEGTQLYHGTWKEERVDGMEWLAFEPEHSLVFTHRRPSRGGPRRGRPGKSPGGDMERPFHEGPGSGHPPDFIPGWLHTYKANKDLRLLYIDGMSAGKTDNGTLDSQDLVLLNSTEPHRGMWEYERALGLCEMAQKEWEGRIYGIVRMEAGFEIILCNFSKDVDLVRVTRAAGPDDRDFDGFSNKIGHFRYMEAVAARYPGIGGDRVRLDYDNFVSAFAYPLELFISASEIDEAPPLPRLVNISSDDLAIVRSDVRNMILSQDAVTATRESFNWQRAADMIVARYSKPLQYLTSDLVRKNTTLLSTYLEVLLRPFIDYSARLPLDEAARCSAQFASNVPAANTSLAAAAVHAIADKICSVLSSALSSISDESDDDAAGPKIRKAGLANAVFKLDGLVDYLQWTSWKQCRGCGDDEICFVPIWPFGAVEDHKRPRCLDADSLVSRMGYWGIWWGRPPPDKGEKGGKRG
ncbi:uncharacterized protein BDZ99DRAFT_345969, partial [Mytilinidion resinicola]